MTIKDELETIRKRDRDGVLRVEAVHDWAKAHPRSDLHKAIEWDVDAAALQWQFQQIRQLIKLHIVTEDGEPEIVSLSIDRVRPGGGYRNIDDVVADKDLSEVMLDDALAELERMRVKYRFVKELTAVWDATDKVRSRVKRKQDA